MPIGPTTYFGKERVFVDREACIQAFRENIQKSGAQEYNVLFYHGTAGIGKSKLQTELQGILNKEYPEIVWTYIDLNTKTYREVGTFLITLRNEIQKKCTARFYLFNTTHAIYWKKLHPEIPLQKENYPLVKEDGWFSKIIDVLDEFVPIHAEFIWNIINNAPDKIVEFFKKQAIDIDRLASMDATEIEKLLPGFFAADFTSYLGTNLKAYIFIDTYEVIWKDLRDIGSFHEKDAWIRDNLIPNMPGVSWVISGRDKLRWTECDPDWNMYLEQHPVDELPENYCTEFLEDCSIENKDIRDIIIKASEGVPYYLNLSVETFETISKKRGPVPEDFGKMQDKIFNSFVKYLDRSEKLALTVLSVPNFWDKDLFEILMTKFGTGFPTGAFLELTNFSFIKQDADGNYSIHQLMRKSLQEFSKSINIKDVHKFMFEYYSNKIKEIDIKAITQEHEIALVEAFYHAKGSLEAKDLLKWFITDSDSFDKAAFWKLIIPMYEEILQIIEAKLGPEHPDVAATLNNLAVAATLNNLALLYRETGEYEKALPHYKRALKISEKVLGTNHSDIATITNNLGLLYHQMGDYENALKLYQKALEIREKVLGSQHPDVATTINNLADLYRQKGDYKKAQKNYQRALEIREKVLGSQHPDVAITLNNLGLLNHQMGDYENALKLYQKALEIREKVLGSQHPEVATTINNLAGLYENCGDYENALKLNQKALEIREKILEPKHPLVAITLNNQAILYESMGDYKKALPLYQRALEIMEKKLGQTHPNTIVVKNNYNRLLSKRNKNEKK